MLNYTRAQTQTRTYVHMLCYGEEKKKQHTIKLNDHFDRHPRQAGACVPRHGWKQYGNDNTKTTYLLRTRQNREKKKTINSMYT